MANLQTYHPFGDLFDLQDELSRFFWGTKKAGKREEEKREWVPAVDISENEKELRIHAELPGIDKKDVSINVEDSVLTIRGKREFKQEQKKENYYRLERSYGVFARSFSLPNSVDVEKIQASMKDGVLELSIPKKPEAQPKQIDIG